MKTLFVLLFVLCFAVPVFAQEQGGGGGVWEFSHGPGNVGPDPDCCGQGLSAEELADLLADQAERDAEAIRDAEEQALREEELRLEAISDALALLNEGG